MEKDKFLEKITEQQKEITELKKENRKYKAAHENVMDLLKGQEERNQKLLSAAQRFRLAQQQSEITHFSVDKTVLLLVGTRCRPELEGKFNRWYNQVHIPMLLKFKGLQEVTRYKVVDEEDKYPRYLATYRFDNEGAYQAYQVSPEMDAARQDIGKTWQPGDMEIVWRVRYEPMQSWEK